jgi:hypothetical protein
LSYLPALNLRFQLQATFNPPRKHQGTT